MKVIIKNLTINNYEAEKPSNIDITHGDIDFNDALEAFEDMYGSTPASEPCGCNQTPITVNGLQITQNTHKDIIRVMVHHLIEIACEDSEAEAEYYKNFVPKENQHADDALVAEKYLAKLHAEAVIKALEDLQKKYEEPVYEDGSGKKYGKGEGKSINNPNC